MNALLDSMPKDLPHLIVQQQTGEAALSQTMRRLAALQGKERSQVLAAFAQLNADPDKLLSTKRRLRANCASSCCAWAFLTGLS